jgi:hypothetical protein
MASSLDGGELYAFKRQYDRRHQCGDEYVSAPLISVVRFPSGSCAEARSYPLEISAFGDREALQVAAQAVETELDGT